MTRQKKMYKTPQVLLYSEEDTKVETSLNKNKMPFSLKWEDPHINIYV